MSKSEYVYVISAPNGLVKVGRANSAHDRFYMVQCNSPLILTLVYVCQTSLAHESEKATQVVLAPHRQHGEWFRVPAADAVAALRQVMIDFGMDIEPGIARTAREYTRNAKPLLRAHTYEQTVLRA